MRASPPFRISLTRFDAWHAAVAVLTALGLLVIGGWLAGREHPLSIDVVLATGGAAAAMGWLAVSLLRMPAATSLHWDGRIWHLGRPGPWIGEPVPGELSVVIDWGAWMLLRFSPAAPGSHQRSAWLPVQRGGIAPHWHALRCAVYSPRPVSAETSAGS